MRRCSFRSFLFSFALLGAAACGGSEQAQSRTVTVDGAQYELVAEAAGDLSPEEVESLLARAVLVRASTIESQVEVPPLVIEVVPYDSAAPRLSVVAFTAEGNTEQTEAPEDEERSSTTRANFVSRAEIKGATDPDVDPAQPY